MKIAVGVVVLCGLVLAGCSNASSGPPATVPTSMSPSSTAPTTFTTSGSLELSGTTWASDTGKSGDECFGIVGYGDVKVGEQVVVVDATGATVALGTITSSEGNFEVTPRVCTLKFEIENVPAGKNFYSLKFGTRGAPQYTEQQMKDGLSLTLGS